MQDYFSARETNKESQEHGYRIPRVKDAVVPDAEIQILCNSQSQLPTNYKTSHADVRHNKDETSPTVDPQSPRKYAAASVKSMSSTENSRRDSAISAESQQRRRPKTSRSNSKRSLQSGPGEAMSRNASYRQRPRGHRFASSTSINMPHTNIEEALALHARSCQIFAGSSRPSTSYSPVTSPYGSYAQDHYRSLSSADALPMSRQGTHQTSPYQADANQFASDVEDEEDNYFSSSFPPTVMHWTSDEARAKEYAAIDRSNTGVRGLLKKLLPKCVSKGHTKFYDEKDGSDCGSVRRIRLDFPCDKDEPKRSVMPRQFSVV
jgi:hypothetical protein